MHIVNMSLNIFGCLEALVAMLTLVWVCVGFLMSTDMLRLLVHSYEI